MSEITKALIRQLQANHLYLKKSRKYSTRFTGFIKRFDCYVNKVFTESDLDYNWLYLKPEITNDMLRIIIAPDIDIKDLLRKDFLKLIEKCGADKAFKIYKRPRDEKMYDPYRVDVKLYELIKTNVEYVSQDTP